MNFLGWLMALMPGRGLSFQGVKYGKPDLGILQDACILIVISILLLSIRQQWLQQSGLLQPYHTTGAVRTQAILVS